MYHINTIKNQKHLIISIDADNAFGKFQHQFMLKIFNELRNRKEFPQPHEGIYKNTHS